jgi:hypothetical protein
LHSNSTIFGFKTYAPPVWTGSVAAPVKYRPMTKREAVKLYHRARAFERQTRQPGKQNGALGRTGLAVLHCFLFDFFNFRSGRLDPGYRAIARAAAVGLRSVPRALQRLRDAGIIHWLRRCATVVDEAGRFALVQETNAYGINPATHWRGFRDPPPPEPEAGTWGDHPCGTRDPLTEGVADLRAGASTEAMIRVFESDADEGLAWSLARLGRAAGRAETLAFPDVPGGHRNRN